MTPRMLVVAKAPVPGQVKTRLGDTVGMRAAAELAAAALLDTIEACAAAADPSLRHLALAGDLEHAAAGDDIATALAGWRVTPQRGDGFAERLARAHADGPGPVVQIGMDTPQVDAVTLVGVAETLADHDAVLGPAADGGWWVLALHDPRHAAVLTGVPMSTAETYDATLAALRGEGLDVATTAVLRDVDDESDADAVARTAPHTRFARAWAGVTAR
jgi:uncharacterized protein